MPKHVVVTVLWLYFLNIVQLLVNKYVLHSVLRMDKKLKNEPLSYRFRLDRI